MSYGRGYQNQPEQGGRDYYRPPPSDQREQDYRRDARPYDPRDRAYDPRDQRSMRAEERYDDRRAPPAAGPSAPAWNPRGGEPRGGERDQKRGRYDDYDQNRGYAQPPRRDDYPRQDHRAPQQQHYEQAQGPYKTQSYPPQQYEQPRPPPAAQNYPYQNQRDQRPPLPSQQYRAPYDNKPLSQRPEQRSGISSNDRSNDFHSRGSERSLEPPSQSVVFLGLPSHVDDAGLRAFLEDIGAAVDNTTIIYDRATGLSKRYGFAKFASVEHARAFVDPIFPSITWREPPSSVHQLDNGIKIRINYSQKNGGWRDDHGSGARQSEDHRKAQDAVAAPQPFYVNDGTRDIGSAPTQILLLRGLDTLTTEMDIVTSLGKITGRIGSEVRNGGVRKVLITKDRASRSSWGYAFVQFSNVTLATEVLGTVFNPAMYPTGYRIRSSVVAFSFCHENSFVPVYAHSEWAFQGEGGQQLTYWDDKAFVSAWVPTAPRAVPAGPTRKQPGATTDSDVDAFLSSFGEDTKMLEVPEAAFVPKTESGPSSSPDKVIVEAVRGPGSIETVVPSAPAASNSASAPALAKKLIQAKKSAPNIVKWNNKQKELAAQSATPVPAPALVVVSPPAPTPIALPVPAATPVDTPAVAAPPAAAPMVIAPVVDAVPYGDVVAMVCLLCQRQFKSGPDLRRHNDLSALHKKNLLNIDMVAEAALRKATTTAALSAATPAPSVVDPVPPALSAPPATDATYIDRAAARREAHDEPEQPSVDPRKRRASLSAAGPKSNAIEEGNGAKMLEKMGWENGNGLGAEGNGRKSSVVASTLAPGAGLGAQASETPKTYAQQAKTSTRSRVEKEE